MILSRKFVNDYIKLNQDLSITQIAEDMTNVGNEYDYAGPLIKASNLITGEVIACEKHPDSDHLHICKVNIGEGILDIVCGAPNVRKGLKVIVAMVGAKLPAGEIKSGKIRGQISNGMLCAKAELGLDNKFLEPQDKNGICELPIDTKVGEDPLKILQLDDEIIDFELTSNRADLLSMLGMAYELGAIYHQKVTIPTYSYQETTHHIQDEFNIKISTNDCSLFLAKKATNLVIKESPDFIKNRLISCGIRPINNVVDISNYVMLSLGQPLHYYDANKLGDTLIVRNAQNNEQLTTLDNKLRTLNNNDIVIANQKEAIGLAGVMGGLSTEVDNNTNTIIIEAAIFDSIKVRKTSKTTLRSEASNRFEKGLDPKHTYLAIEQSCYLLQKYADAQITSGMLIYDQTNKEDTKINLSLTKVTKVLGIQLNKDKIIDILNSLDFKVQDNNDSLLVFVPTRRQDIKIPEDLIEEIGRLYGIDNIVGKTPVLKITPGQYNKTKRAIKDKMISLGLNETLSYTLIPQAEAHKFTNDNFEEIMLESPMSEDKNTLRYSLLYSLKEIYLYNKAHNVKDVEIFEYGKGFYKQDNLYKETNKLAGLMSGNYYLDINDTKVDFYILKGIIEELLDYLGYAKRYSFTVSNIPAEFHPKISANINLQGQIIGVMGKLHPNIVKDDVYAFEIDLDKLLNIHPTRMAFKEILKYPSIEKDVAFIIDKQTSADTIISTIKGAGGKLLTKIKLFDLYTGDNIKATEKSLAFKLTFTDPNKTLTDEEVMQQFNKIINTVETTCHAKLRNN